MKLKPKDIIIHSNIIAMVLEVNYGIPPRNDGCAFVECSKDIAWHPNSEIDRPYPNRAWQVISECIKLNIFDFITLKYATKEAKSNRLDQETVKKSDKKD